LPYATPRDTRRQQGRWDHGRSYFDLVSTTSLIIALAGALAAAAEFATKEEAIAMVKKAVVAQVLKPSDSAY
jgi:hypothetical protein